MQLAQVEAERRGLKSITATRDLLETTSGQRMTLRGALEVVDVILSRSKNPVQKVDAYIATACRKPDEVREICDQLDVEALV
jgi:hypothetical protein